MGCQLDSSPQIRTFAVHYSRIQIHVDTSRLRTYLSSPYLKMSAFVRFHRGVDIEPRSIVHAEFRSVVDPSRSESHTLLHGLVLATSRNLVDRINRISTVPAEFFDSWDFTADFNQSSNFVHQCFPGRFRATVRIEACEF